MRPVVLFVAFVALLISQESNSCTKKDPAPFIITSTDGRYFAKFVPIEDSYKYSATVYSVESDKNVAAYKITDLAGRPRHISSDGQTLVTISRGATAETIALRLYRAGKLFKTFRLDKLMDDLDQVDLTRCGPSWGNVERSWHSQVYIEAQDGSKRVLDLNDGALYER